MKWVIWALGLAAMIGNMALADEDFLEGGVFIAHYVPELGYTSEAPALGWCGEYAANYAIDNCNDQNPQILEVAESLPASWFVLAAWAEEKRFCGVEFGFPAYNSALFAFGEYNACFPEEGLEIKTGEWPGPNTGIALVAIFDPLTLEGTPWLGNFVPVIHFGGYAYGPGYAAPGQIPLDVNPATIPFAGSANCLAQPGQWSAANLGALGINTDGVAVCPEPVAEVAACCLEDGSCQVLNEEDCGFAGGVWHPEWDTCGPPNPCEVIAACCSELGTCTLTNQADCLLLGREWLGLPFDYCEPNPCLDNWACCVGTDCQLLSEEDCDTAGGIWFEGQTCDPDPCELGACCADTGCLDLREDQCELEPNSTWHRGYTCAENDCDDLRVCCINHLCYLMWEDECWASEPDSIGWHPTYATCDHPNPCEDTPAQEISWGKIKTIYR